MESAEQFEYNARGFKQVMDHYGWDEPLKIGGILEAPTYKHLARDEFEQIMEQRGS